MSAQRLRSQATTGSDDSGNEAGSLQPLGKRSSSESQDVTPAKKKKRTLKTGIKSQVKRKNAVQKKKTALSGKKKSLELSEKEHSNVEENTSLLDEKEKTSERFICLSDKPMEIDHPYDGVSVSDNGLEEKQTNPLHEENEMQVTESDVKIEIKGSSLNRGEESTQSKDVLSKDDSEENISPCHEDKTLCNIKYCRGQEDNPSTNTEITSESSSGHPISSFIKDLTDESNISSTDTELQEKTPPIKNVLEKTGNSSDFSQVTNKTEKITAVDSAQTRVGMSSELILLNKDKIKFKETVCDNTCKTGNVNNLAEERVVTNKKEELKISDEAQTQDKMSSEQTLSIKNNMEFKETVCENTFETVNINDLIGQKELAANKNEESKVSDIIQIQAPIHQDMNETEPKETLCEGTIKAKNIVDCQKESELGTKGNGLQISDEARIQDGMSSEQSFSNEDKMEFNETDCDNVIEPGNIHDLIKGRELGTHENEELEITDEAQTQDKLSSELILSNKGKIEFEETVCDNTCKTENVDDLIEERELVSNEKEGLKISDEAQTKYKISSEKTLSNEDNMEFKETVSKDTIESSNINDMVEEREFVSNKKEEFKISHKTLIQAGMSSEPIHPDINETKPKETLCEDTIKTKNIADCLEEREFGTKGNELEISDEAQIQDRMSSELILSNKYEMEFKETVCDSTCKTGNVNDLVEERGLNASEKEEVNISNGPLNQDNMSSEKTILNQDNMEFKETVCDNDIETGNTNNLGDEMELIANKNEELKITVETQSHDGMSSELILLNKDKIEFKETDCYNTCKTGSVNDLAEERVVTNKKEELKISDEAQTQDKMSSEQTLSIKNNMEFKETVCENTFGTANINELIEERELATNKNEESKVSDETRIQAGMRSEPIHQDISETEPKQTLCEETIKTKNIADCLEEREIGTKGNELEISDEAHIQDGMSSEKSLSNEDKMEFKKTYCDNINETGNINDLIEERELGTHGNEELKVLDDAQAQDGMCSRQIHPDVNETEPKETVCEDTNKFKNITDCQEVRELDTKGNELKISDESQTQDKVSSEQSFSNEDKVEIIVPNCDNIIETGNIHDLVEEMELGSHGNEELKISDESQTQDGMRSKQSLSNEDKMEFKETDCDDMVSGNISDLAEERELITSGNYKLTISDETQTHAGITSEQILSVEEKMEHEENVCENNMGTGDADDCQEEKELVAYQPEQMEISDEEDTNKLFIDETVIRSSQSPEREKYEYKLPAMDDPVWRDRLPPPPGCESPPPYPPLAPKPTPPPASTSLAPKPVPPPALRQQPTKPTPPLAPPLVQEPTPPQYNMNSSLDTAEILKSTKNSSGQLEVEFEISHLPKFTVDYIVKKCVRENQIKAFSGATVRTRGQYVAPDSTTAANHATGHEPQAFRLCLVIKGPSRESIETALVCVKNLVVEGEEAGDIQMIKMFPPPELNQIDHLMGAGRANLLYIAEQTGAEVTLRGRSSGYIEASGSEAPWPLHLRIRHKSSEGLLKAMEITSNLIQTVTKEIKEFCTPGQQPTVQSAGQVVSGVQSTLVPALVPAPEVASPHTTPPPSHSSSWSLQPSVPGRVLAGSSTPIVSFPPPVIVTPFAVNPLNPLAYFETAGQLANQAGNSSSKVVYESGPQLKSQKTSTTSSNSSTANTSQTPFQFTKPPPPMPRPHPRPTLAVSTSNTQVPPPLRNPPSTTPLHLRPSSSSASPEIRSSLTFRPQNKKGETEVKKPPRGVLTSQTSKKEDKKPKKIQFSIITASKKNKIVPGNPMVQKKTSLSENPDETGAEKSTTNKASEDEMGKSSSLEKKDEKTSRWGQKPESLPQPRKIKQLLEKLNDQINNMICGGDKFRLIKIFNLLQTVPQAHEINDKDRAQLKVIKELLQKTLVYLPSGQLSITLCEILTELKTEFNILTDEESASEPQNVISTSNDSASEPQNVISTSNDKTWWQRVVVNDGKAHNKADARETTQRRETTRSRETTRRHETTRRQETTRRREKESHKSSSSTKHYAHTSKSHVQESRSRRETHRNSSNKASDLRMSGTSTQEQNQRGCSPKSSSDKQSRPIKESTSSNRKTRSEIYGEKQDPLKSEVSSPKPSKSQLSDELNKIMEHSSGASTKEQEQGDFLKTFLDKQNRKMTETNQSVSSNRKTSSEMYWEKENPKTFKPEVSSPKPSKSQLSGELNKIMELSSGASTQEQKLGDSLKTLSGSSTQNSSLKMCVENQEPKTMKTEVLSPKPLKSPLSGELNKIVELLHRALKTATNSLQNNNVKLELSKIAQLLEHAIPTGAEVSDEQKSQFLIVLDVLEQTLQRNISTLGQESVHLTSIIALLKNLLDPNYKSVNRCDKDNKNTSLTPSSSMHLTQTSSETRQLPGTKVRNELGDQQPDQLSVITHLLQKAIKTFADTLGQGIMKTRLTVISQSLEEAASKGGKSTQKEQSNLLTIIELLEQLLTTNQLSPSHQPKELLSIMQQLKHVLKSKSFGDTTNIQHNIFNPVEKIKIPPTNVQTLNTPKNQNQSQLLQIIQLLQKALYSYCTSMEQGYLKSQLTQISQMLDRELQEHVITMSPEKLKKQMSPLIQLLHQLLQNQPTSNQESKLLIDILQHIEKSLNPPVTMNQINPQASNLLGNLQQLQMLQTLQQQMQGGSQLGMGLPFQPMQMQAAPIANNLLQLQLMQVMQQMQAALGSQSQQPANPVSNQLNQLSQQLQTLQQQFTQVSQLNQQQSFQSTPVTQQQSLLQSYMRPATMTQPQANLSDLMLQMQQASQQFKGSE